MPAQITIMINGTELRTDPGKTILQVCEEQGVRIPTLCHFDGISEVGACRLCLVEIEGAPRLLPACTTPVNANQKILTHTDKLQRYRRMITELFFAERKHICSVCVANNNCELQDLAQEVGMTHVRFPYLNQDCALDASHRQFVMDHNRCILCTRCVRVCHEIEGAHSWDVMGRSFLSRIINDFNQPWGESTTCTSCGKCVQVCPTGALWPKPAVQGSLQKHPEAVSELADRRKLHA